MQSLLKISLVLAGLFSAHPLFAQDEETTRTKSKRELRKERINQIIRQEEEGVVTYHKHMLGGIKLTNDGYGGFFEVGRARSVNRALLFQLEVTERKHVKEEKLQNEFSPTAPVIYGKINYFYPIKLGVQQQLLLGNKGNRNGVCVSANYGGGLSLGLLRPYLVQVDKGNGIYEFVGYNSPDSNYFLNGPIIGGPSLGEGWKNLKLQPGFYAKAAARFDYGKYNELISGLEIGGTLEYYFQDVPQMIRVKRERFFLGAYVSLLFGRRKA